MKNRSSGAARLAVAGLVAAAVAAAVAFTEGAVAKPKRDPRTYDLKKNILGQSAGKWTAEWWQWCFSIPPGVHPLVDTTGEFVEVGQWGPVWFLGGVLGSGQADRTATIPTGKSLLVPIINADWDALDPNTPTFELMKQAAAQYIGEVDTTSLKCVVDGTPIVGLERTRVVSSAFSYHVPEDNFYKSVGINVGRGIFNPAVSDGYWVFLKPLPVGVHTIECEARTKPPNSVTQSYRYTLTVVDHNRP